MNIYDVIINNNINNNGIALKMRYDNREYKEYSYPEVFALAKKYAEKLKNAGIKAGDRVAIVSQNSPEWIISFIAIISLQCTAVLIDSTLSAMQMENSIVKADTRGVFLTKTIRKKISIDSFKQIPLFDLENNANGFHGDVVKLDSDFPDSTDIDLNIPIILFSSGTTGTSKAVMHTHEGILYLTERLVKSYRIEQTDRQLAVIPLCHIYGFMAKLMATLYNGAQVCFIESMTAENLSAVFKEYKPTTFCCVPGVFDMFANKINAVIKEKGRAFILLSNILMKISYGIRKATGINLGKTVFKSVHKVFGGELKACMSAGAKLDIKTAKQFYALGFCLFNNYGITETNIPISASDFSYFSYGTIGKPYSGVQVITKKNIDRNVGEFLVKSKGMMKGYFRDIEANKNAFDSDGWFKTGDIGYFDKEGNMVITGRLKENIILATGKKTSPQEIESLYKGITGTEELIICGVPSYNDKFYEIHAFIVKSPIVTENYIEEEINNISENLPTYMRISRIHFVDEIPKTSLKKPKRYMLTEFCKTHKELNESNQVKNSDATSAYTLTVNVLQTMNIECKDTTPNTRMIKDLGMDSLSLSEFCLLIENKTGMDIYAKIKPETTILQIADIIDKASDYEHIQNDKQKYPMKKGLVGKLYFGFASFIVGLFYKFEVTGLSNLPQKKGYILCPNHETSLDPLWILMNMQKDAFLRFHCMAKHEIQKSLSGKMLLKASGGIPVDRTGNARLALKTCFNILKQNAILLIHPEGTRTYTGKLGEFKNGASKLAIETGTPIVPVKMEGGFKIFPRNKKFPKLFNFKSMKRYTIRIKFGQPIYPKNYSLKNLTGTIKSKIISM